MTNEQPPDSTPEASAPENGTEDSHSDQPAAEGQDGERSSSPSSPLRIRALVHRFRTSSMDTQELDQRVQATFTWIVDRLPKRIGNHVRKVTGGRFGIGSQVWLGLSAGILLTLAASAIALGSMMILNGRLDEVADHQVPGLIAAFEVERISGELVAASPRLAAAMTPEDLDLIDEDLRTMSSDLSNSIGNLVSEREDGQRDDEIAELAASMLEALNNMRLSADIRMGYQNRLTSLESRIESELLEVSSLLEEEKDDQSFFMSTGWRELSDAVAASTADRLAPAELAHHESVLGADASLNSMVTLMLQGVVENDRELLLANRERVETERADVDRYLADMRASFANVIRPSIDTLDVLYMSPNGVGVFATRSLELEEIERSEDLRRANEETAAELGRIVSTLVQGAAESTRGATEASSRILGLGFWLILGFNLLGVVIAIVLGWKFFGEMLLSRIRNLSGAMARMSHGDLDVEVNIAGNDEVTDMAGALEVFRRHALEVQRLNLVEKLADEVQAKNDELQKTLEDLRVTQQQVIQQEKLASLGALTAGIAHEIRNPLNFVNNFAVLSVDLISEMREELGLEDGNGSDEDDDENGDDDTGSEGIDLEYIDEILGDLNMNVTKVREHGMRADSIVEGMLAHSRGKTADPESIKVNGMLNEYANLAYHGLRATNPEFNVTIEREYDDDAGEVTGIARDLSRVFLNIVTNAFHATDARRVDSPRGSFSPKVTLRTEGSDNEVVVSIRDNGTGMPEHVLAKIFDPFFTTKSGTQGTGLGLSITHEIVQEHGGTLEVDTEVNEFTEFRVTLPRKPPLVSAS